MSKNKDGTMEVLEHLAELRLRLLISAGAFLVTAGLCFFFIDPIRGLVGKPLEGLSLYYLSPPEAFMANLKLALLGGVILALPVIIYELSAFVFPGLNRAEKIFYLVLLFGIILFFSGGVIFAYYIAFPFTLDFFLQFAAENLEPRYTISDYLSFLISFHMGFGLVFQLPLLSWTLGRLGLLSTVFLRKHRKTALLVMCILSAIITPPDVISQVVMIFPLVLLYEIGIVMVMISEKNRNKQLQL